MTDKQIKYMVNRFLAWRLPENFNPDAGISFKAAFNEHTTYPMKHQPVGTNLFDADQAEAMVRHMIEGMPREGFQQAEQERDNWIDTANRELRNTQYYRDLIIQVGEMIGESARTCDDGSKSEDILCAKVPDLVRGRFDSAKRLQELTLQNELRWMRKHTEAEQEAERLRKALQVLCDRLDFVHEHPNYQSVWTMYMIHGGKYTGPTYTQEFEAAKAVLAPQPTEAQEDAGK